MDIRVDYKADGKVKLDGRLFNSWSDFNRFFIQKYSGKQVNLAIFYDVIPQEKIKELNIRKKDLLKRIADNCQSPDARCPCPNLFCG